MDSLGQNSCWLQFDCTCVEVKTTTNHCRYEGESEPSSEGYESSSERDVSLELPAQHQLHQLQPPTYGGGEGDQDLAQDFNIPNMQPDMQTDIPGLEDLISSESKSPGYVRAQPSRCLCFSVPEAESASNREGLLLQPG